MQIGVLALQGDVREHIESFARLGVPAAAVRTLQDIDGIDGLVIPGGESTAMSRLLVVTGLYEPLRERIAAGLPAFGSCAGMILLARQVIDTRIDACSFGAIDMVVRRNAFGRQADSFETDITFAGIDGPPVSGVFIRAPRVESVGHGVEVLAQLSDASPGAGSIVAVRTQSVLATAFHPEVTGDDRVHQVFLDMVASSL